MFCILYYVFQVSFQNNLYCFNTRSWSVLSFPNYQCILSRIKRVSIVKIYLFLKKCRQLNEPQAKQDKQTLIYLVKTKQFKLWNALFFFVDPGSERYTLSFTLRDSPTDYVNVTCWGNGTFIKDLAKSFKINDVGKFVSEKLSELEAIFDKKWWVQILDSLRMV